MRAVFSLCLLGMAIATAASCGRSDSEKSGSDAPINTSPTPTPTPTPVSSTTFQGTIAGRNGQTGTVNVSVQATVSITSLRPSAVQQATGTVRPAGKSTVSLSGTFDDASGAVALSGGGYTFSGTVGSGGVLAGTYTGPESASGGFSTLNSTTTPVTVYCGIAEESDGPIVFTLQISANGAVSGTVFEESSCGLTGQITGTSLSITDCYGRHVTATTQGGAVSGKTPSGNSFSGTTSACQ